MARLLLVALVLEVFWGQTGAWEEPKFCHNDPCPEYSVDANSHDFEERHYVETSWLTIKVNGNSPSDFIAAEAVLKDYRQKNGIGESWPLLTFKECDQNYLSWFVPPGTYPEDPSVEVRHFPKRTMFVRNFGGIPTAQNAKDNVDKLIEALAKPSEDNTYFVAFYQHFSLCLTYYNEAWVPSD